jgi:hypothetical protein
MADGGSPVRKETARLAGVGAKGQGTLLLYPDRLIHVRSRAGDWGFGIGLLVVVVAGLALGSGGPGGIGGAIIGVLGWLTGNAVARRLAPRRADGAMVIPLDSVTGLRVRKRDGFRGRLYSQSLLVTTADGKRFLFSTRADRWSAPLAMALAARGRKVVLTPEGMVVEDEQRRS